jgi:hypothetical protein
MCSSVVFLSSWSPERRFLREGLSDGVLISAEMCIFAEHHVVFYNDPYSGFLTLALALEEKLFGSGTRSDTLTFSLVVAKFDGWMLKKCVKYNLRAKSSAEQLFSIEKNREKTTYTTPFLKKLCF